MCRFCNLLKQVFAAQSSETDEILYKRTYQWEEGESNAFTLWNNSPEAIQNANSIALKISKSDPDSALKLFREAAEHGSAWAMERVGWHYESGTAVEVNLDQAEHFYHQAIVAGSWMATISYARLMFERGKIELCEEVLNDGIKYEFRPAYFWLSWFQYKRKPNSRTAREIRPMVENAARAGHPKARLFLASLMANGKLGIVNIPKGVRDAWRATELLEPVGQIDHSEIDDRADS
jgi:TPR repeat protein